MGDDVGGMGVIAWSPDYKTEKDMSLPSDPIAASKLREFGSAQDMEERRLLAAFRALRPGQTMEVTRDAEGRFWRTKIDDVTEDPT